ncbi:MAG TPA: hypothetical protein G4O02_04775 [Caldilineae bacterium]|nr:hypothetical protein [Caldilineae bacterium]
MIERVEYAGWPNCYRLSDGRIEIVATSDVGPRIVRLSFVGDRNLFGGLEEEMGLTGGDEWRLYGGHRLWHSPEAMPRSYYPDNEPVDVKTEGDVLTLTPPLERTTGIQKIMRVALVSGHFEVTHTLRNEGLWTIQLAPWALSVMALRSVAIVPQPQAPDPTALLPNRSITLWPYTDMADPRWHWGTKFVTLCQDPSRGPTKFGISATDGWCACWNDGQVFIKRFEYQPGAAYPDNGCTVECYANERFLELETLGPLVWLEPGASVTHVERWYIFSDVECEVTDEASIEAALTPLLEQTK